MCKFHLTKNQDSMVASPLTITLDGKLITDKDQLYESLSVQLLLPDYFGKNLDALFDLLTDYETFNESDVIFNILNYDDLLNKEPNTFKKELILLLADAMDEWKSSDEDMSFSVSCIESEELLGDLQELGISYYRDEF